MIQYKLFTSAFNFPDFCRLFEILLLSICNFQLISQHLLAYYCKVFLQLKLACGVSLGDEQNLNYFLEVGSRITYLFFGSCVSKTETFEW